MFTRILCHSLEIARWGCVIIGFQLAYAKGASPQDQLHILMPWLVIPLAGLTGLESIFLSKSASSITGYTPSAYQRQSGFNNLAMAITAVFVFLFRWGTHAEATVLFTLLIFLCLSALNHAYSILKEKNMSVQNLLRPGLTLALLVFTLPIVLKALF